MHNRFCATLRVLRSGCLLAGGDGAALRGSLQPAGFIALPRYLASEQPEPQHSRSEAHRNVSGVHCASAGRDAGLQKLDSRAEPQG